MKQLTYCILFLLCVGSVLAQEKKDETYPENHPYLENPKVKKIIALHNDIIALYDYEKYLEIQGEFQAGFKSNDKQDLLDLLTYACANYQINDVLDFSLIGGYPEVLKIIEETLQFKPDNETPENTFQRAVFAYVVGIAGDGKSNIDFAFHQFEKLIDMGWKKPLPLMAYLTSRMYEIEAEHASLELVAGYYIYAVSEFDLYKRAVNTMADAFRPAKHSENTLSSEDVAKINRRVQAAEFVVQEFFKEYPDHADIIANELWKDVLNEGLALNGIFYQEEYGRKLSKFLQGTGNPKAKETDLFYNAFFNRDSDNNRDLESIIKLNGSKQKAVERISFFLTQVFEYPLFEILGTNVKWPLYFEEALKLNPVGNYPLLFRHSDNFIEFLNNQNIPLKTVEEATLYMPQVMQSLTVHSLINHNIKGEYYIAKAWAQTKKIDQIREQKKYKNSQQLKFMQANLHFAFETLYARKEKIHSPTAFSLINLFDNWTEDNFKQFPKKDIEGFLASYTSILVNSPVFQASLEGEMIMTSIEKLGNKFGIYI